MLRSYSTKVVLHQNRYYEFLVIINDLTHEDHASMLRCVGGSFDPAAYDLAEINERLATIKVWPSRRPRPDAYQAAVRAAP